MNNLLYIDLLKVRNLKAWVSIVPMVLVPVLYSVLMYSFIMVGKYQYDSENDWLFSWAIVSMFYGTLFYPLISCSVVSLFCKVENDQNNWQRMFLYPITKWKLFYSKVLWSIITLLIIQIFALLTFGISSLLLNTEDPIPYVFLLKCAFLGWIGIIPLVIIQILLMILLKSTAKSLAFNLILILPGFAFTTSELRFTAGYFYPWSLPAMGMTQDIGGISSMYLLSIGILIPLLFFLGTIYFRSAEIK
jgi:hypothetical protein